MLDALREGRWIDAQFKMVLKIGSDKMVIYIRDSWQYNFERIMYDKKYGLECKSIPSFRMFKYLLENLPLDPVFIGKEFDYVWSTIHTDLSRKKPWAEDFPRYAETLPPDVFKPMFDENSFLNELMDDLAHGPLSFRNDKQLNALHKRLVEMKKVKTEEVEADEKEEE